MFTRSITLDSNAASDRIKLWLFNTIATAYEETCFLAHHSIEKKLFFFSEPHWNHIHSHFAAAQSFWKLISCGKFEKCANQHYGNIRNDSGVQKYSCQVRSHQLWRIHDSKILHLRKKKISRGVKINLILYSSYYCADLFRCYWNTYLPF